MKKGIVIILAVAIIGVLGIYGKSRSSTPATSSTAPLVSTVKSTNTKANNTDSPSSMPGSSSAYKDGTYTGALADTVYGPVQISIVISRGKISDVNFLRMPNDLGHTQEVTAMAEPLLKDETLSKQSTHIDFVSGATQTSEGYHQSLQSALDQAA
jgi:uncharacterized protein with FMN-binding domain